MENAIESKWIIYDYYVINNDSISIPNLIELIRHSGI